MMGIRPPAWTMVSSPTGSLPPEIPQTKVRSWTPPRRLMGALGPLMPVQMPPGPAPMTTILGPFARRAPSVATAAPFRTSGPTRTRAARLGAAAARLHLGGPGAAAARVAGWPAWST